MKCKECNSCLKIYRIDYEKISKLYFYCSFCKIVCDRNKNIITDKKIKDIIIKRYNDQYGKKVI